MSDQNHFNQEPIVNAVLSFINARDLAESKAIVQAHQDDLLIPETFQVFEALLMQHKEDEKTTRLLEDHRSLLLRCQNEGIDAAFADLLLAQFISEIPPELLARLKSIRTDAELRELIEEHPELLPVIQQMANQSQAPQERSTDVSSPDELPELLQELNSLNRLSDMPRRVELCQTALGLVDRNAEPELWSGLQNELGNSLAQSPFGSCAENIELAIDNFNQALQVRTREAFPEQWAATRNNLAAAYWNRIRGDRAENIDLAIDNFNQALQVRTREAFPKQWAATRNNLAAAYWNRIRGDRAENIDLAIDYYNQALQVYTREAFPEQWATTWNNLAAAYSDRIRGDRAENIDLAIDNFNQALQVRTREAFPEDWAMTQNNLAAAYWTRIRGDRAENIDLALDYYNQALQVYTREAFPEKWAMTRNNLAIAYSNRIRGERAENIDLAIDHYNQALQVRTREAFPEQWAGTLNNLAMAYSNRIRGERAENIDLAIDHYNQALQVRTREAFPEQWAGTLNNLAMAYSDRIRGERAENIDLAIDHYNQALQVYTREAFPEKWAMTLNNLAMAYSDRIRGERAENIDLAIDHYNQALQVRTRKAFPEQWAGTRNNLANAYINRIRGERAENIDLAIDHYNQALQVRTREAFPEQWAGTLNNLANAYINRIRGERAENIDLAIDHYNQALQVYTREAFPEKWAGTRNNLAAAYSNRIRGERAENIDLAIDHYNQALQVYTREAFPEKWAMTRNNLAAAYSNRIRGERAENIDLAIDHYNQALQVYTHEVFPEKWAGTRNNLAAAYSHRIRGERAENIDIAIDHYNQALQVYTRDAFPEDWAMTQNNLAIAYSDRIRGKRAENIDLAIDHYNQALQVRTLERFPADRRQTLRNLGDLHFTEQSWKNALSDYNGAIEAGNAVLAEAHTEVGRKAEVGETSGLYARSAYCLLKLEPVDKAVLRLEEGKTRLLIEALALAEADLDMLSEKQKQAMSEAREAVRLLEAEMRLPSDDIDLGKLLRQKRIHLNGLVDNLRSQHPDFMPTGLDLPGILGLIPEGGTLVAPLVTSEGSAVIVIPYGADSVGTDHVIMLDSLTEDDLLKLLQKPPGDTGPSGWMNAYFAFCNERTKAAMEQWLEVIEKSTSQLWTMLMAPVHKKLQELNLAEGAPVTLMSQGYLGLLPLHAAWRDVDGKRRTFIDDYTVTYAPSAYSLKISKGRLQDASRKKPSLLAVINPTEDLHYTPVEGIAVESLFDPGDRETLSGNVATKETVVEKVPGWTYLHFSCHGLYNWQDVMNSGLVLANLDILTLSDIISGLNLDTARLVTLSACETGMTDIRQSPEEFIGLPTGFLQAGAAGVVSTLWAVSDAATSLLIKYFYQEHLKEGLPPDQALRSAQLWLRDATRQELGETYKSITRMRHTVSLLWTEISVTSPMPTHIIGQPSPSRANKEEKNMSSIMTP